MDIRLKIPYAEKYAIPLPKNMKGSKARDEYIRQFLIKSHPGFSSESLWDYFITKKEGVRTAEAAVIDRDFYVEKRILDKNCVFYFEAEDSKRTNLFSRFKFQRNGERKRRGKPLLLFFLFPLFAVAVFGIVMITKPDPHQTEENPFPVIEVQEVRQYQNIFDFINNCCAVLEKYDVFISAVQFTSERAGILEFSAEGNQPYELIKELNETEAVINCTCGNIVYKDDKAAFEIRIETEVPHDMEPSDDEMFLLDLQGKLSDEFKKTGTEMISSSIIRSEGCVSFLMIAREESLQPLNEKMGVIFSENNLYTVKLSESSGGTDGSYQVNAQVILLKDDQTVESPVTDEKISEIFIRKKQEKKPLKMNGKKEQSGSMLQNGKNMNAYQKIGTVKKDGKVFYYYRTEENRIFISEEEL